jgi:alpha-glucosidase
MPEENFYGLGDKYGEFKRNGKLWKFWNRDVGFRKHSKDPRYTSIPFLISQRQDVFCGWLVDHPGYLEMDVGKIYKGLFSFTGAGNDADIYFMRADSLKELMGLLRTLIGKSFMPPLWALGYHQSRYSYFSQAEVERVADEFSRRDIPLSALYLDIHYMDDYKVFTVDKKRFPDLEGMAKKLNGKGVKLVAIVDPGLKRDEGYAPYKEAVSKNILCMEEKGGEYHAKLWPRDSAFPDFFSRDARQFWAEQHRSLFDQGITGIWNDMNEPSFWKSEIRLAGRVISINQVKSPKIVHKIGERKIKHEECRNLYGQEECRATVQAFNMFRPGMRHFLLSRSGFTGINRYAAVWTGDNKSSFEHLRGSINEILSWGMSGVGFAGADIGGFEKDCWPELYARWIQLGAFYPFCRTHSAIRTRPQEPYRFGAEVEEIARKYIKLRYSLMPMIYSLLRESVETGLPLWRPLMMEFPKDHAAPEIEDQVMFGEFLMLAPVLKAGAKSRAIYLPAGKWVDFWDEKLFQGPGWIDAPVNLDKLPIVVREGAILVSQPLPGLKIPWPELAIDVYPASQSSRFQLFEDDGETDEYLHEDFAMRELMQSPGELGAQFRLSGCCGKLAIPDRKMKVRFHLQDSRPKIIIDGRERQEFVLNESKKLVELEMMLDATAHEIDLKF